MIEVNNARYFSTKLVIESILNGEIYHELIDFLFPEDAIESPTVKMKYTEEYLRVLFSIPFGDLRKGKYVDISSLGGRLHIPKLRQEYLDFLRNT